MERRRWTNKEVCVSLIAREVKNGCDVTYSHYVDDGAAQRINVALDGIPTIRCF